MRQYQKTIVRVFIGLMIIGCWSLPILAEVGVGIKGGMLLPDRNPFKKEFDSNYVIGGVLEFDSNMGPTVEASVEYYTKKSSIASLGGDISIIPIVLSVKYNFWPRYRTTLFVGVGVGTYLFDREYKSGKSITATRYGTRVSAGVRFLQDRQFHLIFEGARNFTDFEDMNASSFQFSLSILYNFSPTVIAAQ